MRTHPDHDPDDHYDHCTGGWVLLGLLFILFIVSWVMIAYWTSAPATARRSDTGEFLNAHAQRSVRVVYPVSIDNDLIDDAVDPCDSLFHHACGAWISQHSNENRAFTAAARRNAEIVTHVIRHAPTDTPVGAFYASCLRAARHGAVAESRIERKYLLASLMRDFESVADVPAVLGKLAKLGFTVPFSLSIEKHPLKPEMIPLFRWDGFVVDEQLVTRIFSSNPANSFLVVARKTLEFMDMNARLSQHFTNAEGSITDYFLYLRNGGFQSDVIEMRELLDGTFDWQTFLYTIDGTALYFPKDLPVWCVDQPHLRWFSKEAMTTFTVKQWKTYVEFSILYHMHDFVPRLPDDSYFMRHDWAPVGPHARQHGVAHVLKNDTTSSDSDRARCVRATQYLLPGLVSELYIEQSLKHAEETRRNITRLVEELLGTYKDLIRETEWLDGVTQLRVFEKIDAIVVRVVHPTTWEPERFAHPLIEDQYLRNLNMIRRYRVRQNLILLQPTFNSKHGNFNRDAIARFGAPLSTVNAFYSPSTNTITVFAGILQPPFYDARYSRGSLFATLGTIVSHELFHAMDNTGRLYDADGSFHPDGWWTPASQSGFRRHSQCLVDEYSAADLGVTCSSDAHAEAYGRRTLGENIADVGGVKLAYETFVRHGHNVTDRDRRSFWMTLGQLWCEASDAEHLCARIQDDVHSVPVFRVDKTCRNIAAFKDDYQCPESSRMARSEEHRCKMYGH